jgi:hypothetical protein
VTCGASVAVAVAAVAAGAASAQVLPAHLTAYDQVIPPQGGSDSTASTAQSLRSAQAAGRRAAPLSQVTLPDVFAVAPQAITAAQLRKLGKLRDVRNFIAVDGGAVKINGRQVNLVGVNPAQFRAWTPPQTAAVQSIWTALAHGQFVTTTAAKKALRLRQGSRYQVAAGRQPQLTFGGTANLVVPGVDAIVGTQVSKELGLVSQLGVLISAPGPRLATLESKVRGVLGQRTKFVDLRQSASTSTATPASQPQLPVDNQVGTSRPSTWLSLFQESARLYCPGLSWTVLAAIGQIESADGQNEGPSTAGALGPMQFLPSTWSMWGIDAFGETGTPNIMDPYDAVPSAARYLCAAGAAGGGPAVSTAIFAYNHASWYVAEVLALAREYAQEYS